MEMIRTIQLDVSCEMSFNELVDWLQTHKLKGRVVELIGPAGGNPLIEVTGERDNVLNLLEDYGLAADEVADLYPDL